MPTVDAIVREIDVGLRGRVTQAVELLRRQSLGSERMREGVKSWSKEDRSPVTLADLTHQLQTQQMIASRFAGDGLIAEEPRALQMASMAEAVKASKELYGIPLAASIPDAPETARVTWILDPVDGTKGYMAGRYFAIALGFFVNGAPFFAGMAVPRAPNAAETRINSSIGIAIRGRGAWMGRVDGDGAIDFNELRARERAEGEKVRVAVSLEHGGPIGDAVAANPHITTVKLDSQAKYLAVAAGEIDAYLRGSRNDGQPDQTWDHMPGALIASESGCTVRQFDGRAIDFRPDPVIRFAGGMACHCGAPDGRAGSVIAEVIRSASR